MNDPPALTYDERRKLDSVHAVENDDETKFFLAIQCEGDTGKTNARALLGAVVSP